MSQADLFNHIVKLSEADSFELARREWQFTAAELLDHERYCPCGHPIKELCWLHNETTDQHTFVGNVCVGRFMGVVTGQLFPGARRILADSNAAANDALIDYGERLRLVTPRDVGFLRDTRLKRRLSDRQLDYRRSLNAKLAAGLRR